MTKRRCLAIALHLSFPLGVLRDSAKVIFSPKALPHLYDLDVHARIHFKSGGGAHLLQANVGRAGLPRRTGTIALEAFPMLKSDGLVAAVVYYDGARFQRH